MNPMTMVNEYNRLRQLTHTKILKRPATKRIKFECECGCVFETELRYCEKKASAIDREYGTELGFQASLWSHCPICRKNCHS